MTSRISGARVRAIAAGSPAAAAAKAVLEEVNWDPASIDTLVVSTPLGCNGGQSRELHRSLALSDRCAAFDLSAGNGHVYGLWIASGIAAAACDRVLLATTDDGDEYSVTAIERSSEGPAMVLILDSGSASTAGRVATVAQEAASRDVLCRI